MQIEITTQQSEMQKVEREMRLMRERLPPDNQEALEMALAEVVGSQGAAFARLLVSHGFTIGWFGMVWGELFNDIQRLPRRSEGY